MKQLLNHYQLSERTLADSAVHRLNRDPYTLTRHESKRPIYTLTYNQHKNRLEIHAEYFFLDSRQFERKQVRNKIKTKI